MTNKNGMMPFVFGEKIYDKRYGNIFPYRLSFGSVR